MAMLNNQMVYPRNTNKQTIKTETAINAVREQKRFDMLW